MDKEYNKIFYIGLSRSGTTSLHRIISELGLKSVHLCGFLLLDEPKWEMCDQFDALGDSPVPLLFKELDSKYPNSKFIITIRQKEKWLESMKWMFNHGKVKWNWGERIHEYHESFYGTRYYDKRILTKHWNDYHQNVSDYFSTSPDKLLTIRIEDGFDVGDICAFLNLPYREIPKTKFNSRVNISLIKRIRYNIIYYIRRAGLLIIRSFLGKGFKLRSHS
ncbi:hypothetical protein MLD52_11480 [Puniceicoccaceae bacterium K14]|nr:hypothetical protein [Puniceicoccaceae bacterium K14]